MVHPVSCRDYRVDTHTWFAPRDVHSSRLDRCADHALPSCRCQERNHVAISLPQVCAYNNGIGAFGAQ